MKAFSFYKRLVSVCLFTFLCCFVLITDASAKTIMVFAPHPDDELLMTAGIIRQGILDGDTVKVVIITNGDVNGVSVGYARQRESVSGLKLLGMSDQDIIFLGYGDASLMSIYRSSSETTIFTSRAGQTKTYGDQGLGYRDYHSYLYGAPGDYNKATLSSNIETVIKNYLPDEIYVTSLYDNHSDHKAAYLFVIEALVRLKRQGILSPILREVLIHAPCASCNPDYRWPMPSFTPDQLFPKPEYLYTTPLHWSEIDSITVPTEMLNADPLLNLKYQAISKHGTQLTPWLLSFVKKNEFFWEKDFRNLALTANVTVSSQNTSTGQLGIKAVDGIVDGWPGDSTKEWASVNQLSGAWITLSWAEFQEISQIRLYDRPNVTENILSGTLIFSDGSAIQVDTLSNNGAGYTVTFAPKFVTSVTFRVDTAVGRNIGLAEIEVFGPGSKAPTNIQPQVVNGTASPSLIDDLQISNLSVEAFDADGDTLSYRWTSNNGGIILGAGSNATFYPPSVKEVTTFTITVTVYDGRGGSVRSEVFVTVTPTFAVNTALYSSVSVSSQNTSAGQTGSKAVDGIVSGFPNDSTKEWATVGQLAGAWITLNWSKIQTISQIRLFDRINLDDNIRSGTLFFGDGSSIQVGALPYNGAGLILTFEPKRVLSLTFRVDSAVGRNIGLAEIQTLGWSSNIAPEIIDGPFAMPPVINDIQQSNLTVNAIDADGDALSYSWTASGGAISGSGSSAVFTPPRVSTQTVFTVTVTISDGQGGTVASSVPITVTPSFTINIAPSASVSVSSENTSTGQLGIKAVDKVINGWPSDSTKEWATVRQLAGAWITLSWGQPQEISQIRLYDRPNLTDNIRSGTLFFSDGSSIPVGTLPNSGTRFSVDFASKSVTWIRFRVDSAVGSNIGLAEIEVYGY